VALSDLLRRLEEDADSRAAAMLSAAHAEAGRLEADSAAELTRRRTLALAGREAELRASAASEAAIARRAAAAELLETRAALLDRVFERVDASLAERRATAAVLDCAAGDLAAALEYLDGKGTARCRPELVDWLRGRLPAGSVFTVEPNPSAGVGAVLRAPDGSVEIDATVEQRLARLRAQLEVVALGMLGGSDRAAVG
jgi:vacuolar-type H+-ATPase subunit E/Vma4